MAESEESTEIVQTEIPEQTAEISIEYVHKPTPIACGLYPKYVKTLQEADEVMHRFENNTKSRFCVWRSPKDFGHSGMGFSEADSLSCARLETSFMIFSCWGNKCKRINMFFLHYVNDFQLLELLFPPKRQTVKVTICDVV